MRGAKPNCLVECGPCPPDLTGSCHLAGSQRPSACWVHSSTDRPWNRRHCGHEGCTPCCKCPTASPSGRSKGHRQSRASWRRQQSKEWQQSAYYWESLARGEVWSWASLADLYLHLNPYFQVYLPNPGGDMPGYNTIISDRSLLLDPNIYGCRSPYMLLWVAAINIIMSSISGMILYTCTYFWTLCILLYPHVYLGTRAYALHIETWPTLVVSSTSDQVYDYVRPDMLFAFTSSPVRHAVHHPRYPWNASFESFAAAIFAQLCLSNV